MLQGHAPGLRHVTLHPMPPLSDWQTYLAVQAGAAATLTGLVFVAVSINIARIISIPGLPGRAVEALAQLLQVFFIASFALIPRQSAELLAAEILTIVVISLTGQIISQSRYARMRAGHPRLWLVTRIVFTVVATLPFCVCGFMLLFGLTTWIYGLVLGIVISFIAAVIGAWILLIEILR
jgi:hypothetical protein